MDIRKVLVDLSEDEKMDAIQILDAMEMRCSLFNESCKVSGLIMGKKLIQAENMTVAAHKKFIAADLKVRKLEEKLSDNKVFTSYLAFLSVLLISVAWAL